MTQACVVTLNPIRTLVDESFIRRYREGEFLDQTEIDIAVADGDISTFNEDLEPWLRSAEERPSLLDFAVEQLGLILDPFPRQNGAEVAKQLLIDPMDRPETMSPFAALAALRAREARNMAADLCWHSACSNAGTESATTPAPAWT